MATFDTTDISYNVAWDQDSWWEKVWKKFFLARSCWGAFSQASYNVDTSKLAFTVVCLSFDLRFSRSQHHNLIWFFSDRELLEFYSSILQINNVVKQQFFSFFASFFISYHLP